jgi:class 3 adenylate cyclase
MGAKPGHDTEAPAAAREQRTVVTVRVCDLTSSTALGEKVDLERLRALLARRLNER